MSLIVISSSIGVMLGVVFMFKVAGDLAELGIVQINDNDETTEESSGSESEGEIEDE